MGCNINYARWGSVAVDEANLLREEHPNMKHFKIVMELFIMHKGQLVVFGMISLQNSLSINIICKILYICHETSACSDT